MTYDEARVVAHRLLGKWAKQWCDDDVHALVCDTVTENILSDTGLPPDVLRVLRDTTLPPLPGEGVAINAMLARACTKCLSGQRPYWHLASSPCPVSADTPPRPGRPPGW